MTAHFDGLNPELHQRLVCLLAEGGSAFTVTSAVRTRAQQEALYAIYKRDGWPTAAKPGTSKHEVGLAIDVDGPEKERTRLVRKWGFHRPIRGEKWHMEMSPNRKPLTGALPPEEDMDPTRAVAVALTPEQVPGKIGRWILKANGAVDTADTEYFYGGYLNLPESARKGVRGEFYDIKAAGPRNADGYFIFSQDGSVYWFNSAVWDQIRPR